MGGHLDAAIFSVGEFVDFAPMACEHWPILERSDWMSCQISPRRRNWDYPVYSSNLQYWWYPKSTDSKIVDYMADVLKKAMESDYTVNRSNELRIDPRTIVGEELQDRIDRKMQLFSEMKTSERLGLPDVVFWAFVFVAIFGVAVVAKSKSNEVGTTAKNDELRLRFDKAFGVVGMCAIYVLMMGLGIVPFVWATSLFLIGSGVYLTNFDKGRLIPFWKRLSYCHSGFTLCLPSCSRFSSPKNPWNRYRQQSATSSAFKVSP